MARHEPKSGKGSASCRPTLELRGAPATTTQCTTQPITVQISKLMNIGMKTMLFIQAANAVVQARNRRTAELMSAGTTA